MNNISLNEVLILNECNKNYPQKKSDVINRINFEYGMHGDYLSMSFAMDYLVQDCLLMKDNDHLYQITNKGLMVLREERSKIQSIGYRLNF